MAQKCALCGKGYMFTWRIVKLRGKYNPTIKKKKKPNRQWTKLSSGERVKACTKCIKAIAHKADIKDKRKAKTPLVKAETVAPKVEAKTEEKK
jgi:ribosomal protein L28